MKKAKNYADAIHHGVKKWTEWIENGEEILKKERWVYLHGLINRESAKLRMLDPEDVRIDMLATGCNGLEMRLKLADMFLDVRDEDLSIKTDKYGNVLGGLPQYLFDTKSVKPALSDDTLNDEINEYRVLLEEKTLALLHVLNKCSELLFGDKHPIVVKALRNPLLLDAFFDNTNRLEEYIKFCLKAKTPTERARKAKELANDVRLKPEQINKNLREGLREIGIDVGEYKTWQGAANKA